MADLPKFRFRPSNHVVIILFQKGLLATFLVESLTNKPFEKRFDREPEKRLNMSTLYSQNPIGVINRRNGCGTKLTLKKDNKGGKQIIH